MALRALRRTGAATCSIADLPPELLERVLAHAVGTRATAGGLRERQWTSAGDLARARPLASVCRAWRAALSGLVTRFTFFALPASAAPGRTHPAALLRALTALPRLRALQLFLRPSEAAALASDLQTFLARPQCTVHTVHLCMPPAADDAARSHAVSVLSHAVAAGAQHRLRVLSLDGCGTLSHSVLEDVARFAPSLTTLALDCTRVGDWSPLGSLPALAELSLRNCELDDMALASAVAATPALETLAVGYQGESLTRLGLQALSNLRHLRCVELARCAGVRDTGVLALADVSSLARVSLLHVDVSADALVSLSRAMGARLTSLCVTSVRARADGSAALRSLRLPSPGTATMTDVARAVRAHCPNLHSLDFAPSRRPHWSERAYAEALRFAPDPAPTPVLVKVRRKRPRRLTRFFKGLWLPRLPRGRNGR